MVIDVAAVPDARLSVDELVKDGPKDRQVELHLLPTVASGVARDAASTAGGANLPTSQE